MHIPLRYNQATGTMMPSPAPVPAQRYNVPAPPTIIGNVRPRQIPIMPATPIYPVQRYSAPANPHVQGPNFRHIPRGPPQPLRPNFRTLPNDVERLGKRGQYIIKPEGPDTIPKPNLPNFRHFNASAINNAQFGIEQGIRNRGGQLPSSYLVHISPWLQRAKRKPLMMADLGLNSVGGSNSPLMAFGNNVGRTMEMPYFAR